ncbi:MAG: hypothetical protein F6K55_15715 [Moorea sp. SIO4A3]|nr:hypothetical protein [Moorena sp. SIO4A3]
MTEDELIVDSAEQVRERPLAVGHATRTDYNQQKYSIHSFGAKLTSIVS